jgi:hypothetical protein
MSRFMPEMDRNAVQWQEPVGTWRQGEDIGRLDDIARKLVFPPEAENTAKQHSDAMVAAAPVRECSLQRRAPVACRYPRSMAWNAWAARISESVRHQN